MAAGIPVSRTHLALKSHPAGSRALCLLTRTTHTVTELQNHRLAATTAWDRIRLGPGALTDVLSGPAARIRAVQAGRPPRYAHQVRTIRPSTRPAPRRLSSRLGRLLPVSPARLLHFLGTPLAIPRPRLSAVWLITAIAPSRTHSSTHRFTSPTRSRLQPRRLATRRCATRGAGVTGTFPETLRTGSARLLQRRHKPTPPPPSSFC